MRPGAPRARPCMIPHRRTCVPARRTTGPETPEPPRRARAPSRPSAPPPVTASPDCCARPRPASISPPPRSTAPHRAGACPGRKSSRRPRAARRAALRLGRHLRSGAVALSRRVAEHGPALRRSPALGHAAGGARPQRQRHGVERGQHRPAPGPPTAGCARRAGGPLTCARVYALNAAWLPIEPATRSHHLGFRCVYDAPPPEKAALGRQRGCVRPNRGRRISRRPSAGRAPGPARGDPARHAIARGTRLARLGRADRAPDRSGAMRGEPPRVPDLSQRSARPFGTLRQPPGAGGRGLRPRTTGSGSRRRRTCRCPA